MTVRIPTDGKFSQPNKGDIFGNLARTTNVDLKTSPGRMRVSPRLVANTKDNDSGITNMGVPIAFEALNGKYYAITGKGNAFNPGTGTVLRTETDAMSVPFVNDTTFNSPTDIHADFSDAIFWSNGNYVAGSSANSIGPSLFVSTYNVVSKIQKLYQGIYWDTNWFGGTVSGTFRSQGGFKNFGVSRKTQRLYITDDDRIIYVPYAPSTTNLAVQTTNTAGSDGENTNPGTIDFNGKYRPVWIRATSTDLWIGLMSGYSNGSGNVKGYVARWDETGFLPNAIYDIDAPCALSADVVDDVLYIVDAYGILKKFTGTGFGEVARLPVANTNIEMPGIYDSLSNARWIAQRGMRTIDGKLNLNVNNFVSDGVYVENMPSGVWEYDPLNPSQGIYHKSSPCSDTTDYGQQAIATAGAIYPSKRTDGTFLAGYGYYSDNATTLRKGIFHDDIVGNTNKHGILTTPFINSENIEDVFQKTIYRFSTLNAGDSIIGKYRTMRKANYPVIAGCTWVGATALNSTDVNLQYASIGDEVEVIMGVGASSTAHITNIQLAVDGVTYVIDLDDTIGQATGGCKIKVDNFIKTNTFSLTDLADTEMSMEKNDVQVQVKTELRVSNNFQLNDITVVSRKHKPIA